MREIKFRAWDKERELVSGVECLQFTRDGSDMYKPILSAIKTFHDAAFYPEKYVLMQYTGLKDKNGKEIYEGDIVKWVLLERFDEDITEMISEVKFSEKWSGFTPMAMDTDVEDGYYNYRVTEVEVIGNIYENSDLLK